MKLSIRVKLIGFTFCLVLLVGGSIALYSVFQGRRQILTTFENDSRGVTALLAAAMANDLYFLDVRSLHRRLESARVNPDISYTYVMDLDGTVLADGTVENALRDQRLTDPFTRETLRADGWITRTEEKLLKIGGPILMPDGQHIGHLQLGFALQPAFQLVHDATGAILYLTVFCLAVGVVLAMMIATSFTRPLLSLMAALQEIRVGRLGTRLSVKRSDEFGVVGESINQMAEALQKDHEEITRVGESLRESEGRLRFLLETTNAIPWEADARSWRFTYVGPQAVNLLGYPLERWREEDFWRSHLHPDDREYAAEFCLKSSRSLKDYDFEYRMITADGRAVWIHDVVSVVSVNGEPETLRGFMVDITRRKQAEFEAARQRAEVAHIGRVSTAGELAASMAHELNQPLGAILSNAEAAEMFLNQEPPALGEVREILADIRKDDQRAGDVIHRMRALLRRHEMETELLDINGLAEEAVKLVYADAVLRRTELSVGLASGLPPVKGDRVHLQQVLLNLILNGMEAMATIPPGQRELVVRTEQGENGTVKIAVSDSGPGIPPDKLPKLFEPFFTTKKEGLGMGLSIARTIVEAHRGQIWAKSNSGVGATFYVTLPASKEHAA